MDYNTSREKLIIPEYGRHIQKMVDIAIEIEDHDERNVAAKSIIKVMKQMWEKSKKTNLNPKVDLEEAAAMVKLIQLNK